MKENTAPKWGQSLEESFPLSFVVKYLLGKFYKIDLLFPLPGPGEIFLASSP